MDLFAMLALVLGLAAVGGLIARFLKQPPLIGYILAGVILSAIGGVNNQSTRNLIELMGRLGVTLLLFLAGMELPLAELKKLGKVSLVTGIGQIVITSMLGFGLAKMWGFATLTSMYLGIGLTFGSTIMVVKLLSEKGDLQSLAGKIAVGYLLVQDFVAVGLLVVLSGVARGSLDWMGLAWVLIKGVVMIGLAVFLVGRIVGRVWDYLAKSTELLFISSIGWCLVVAALVSSKWLGFSVEIGGLLAGLALANVSEQSQIVSRVKPLRDFFITWFFVYLGANFRLEYLAGLIGPALLFSTYVLLGNPMIVMAILGWLGYGKRTYFMASLAVAQVSEFSLIIISNAALLGQVPERIVSLLTLVAVVTMTGSTYMIWNSHWLYEKLGRKITWFERKSKNKVEEVRKRLVHHAILFGHNRVGSRIRPALEKMLSEVLVVDFNPVVVEKLRSEGINVMYGDMADQELYENLDLGDAAVVVSTVPDVRDNLRLLMGLAEMKRNNLLKVKSQLVVVTANDQSEAEELYKLGASYVLVPHNVGGDFLNQMFVHYGTADEEIEKKLLSLNENFSRGRKR